MSHPVNLRESLWLPLDSDILEALDAFCRKRGLSRHEGARVLLRLGLETVERPVGGAEQLPLVRR
jgi:hypothetical protein